MTQITIQGGLKVPCGKCPHCHSNRKKDWQFRLAQELKASDSAHFITLTYSDENIKYSEENYPSLYKPDVQKFIKRLRQRQWRHRKKFILKHHKWETMDDVREIEKKFYKSIRYYLVGEYGTKTWRPHYHGIFFNIEKELEDKFNETWQQGHTVTEPVNDKVINYVTSYCINPKRKLKNVEPEFAIMSRNPGIGNAYMEKKDFHRQNQSVTVRNNEGNYQRLPGYYKQKFFTEMERKALGTKQTAESILSDVKETKRLESLGNKNPESIKNQQSIIAAEKIIKNSKNGTL